MLNDNNTWIIPDGVVPGDRAHTEDTAKHLHDFIRYHKDKTNIGGDISLPLPERFFNESGYPEHEFVTNWILTCIPCSNAYLAVLRECIVIIIDFISSSKINIKDNGLYKYLTECQKERNFIKGELTRLRGDAIQEKEMKGMAEKVAKLNNK